MAPHNQWCEFAKAKAQSFSKAAWQALKSEPSAALHMRKRFVAGQVALSTA